VPEMIKSVNEDYKTIYLNSTIDQIKHSPKINSDLPIDLQKQAQLHRYYGWDFYWDTEGLLSAQDKTIYLPHQNEHYIGETYDPSLRSVETIIRFKIYAQDKPIGNVDDFYLDYDVWRLRYLLLHINDRKQTLFPTQFVSSIGVISPVILLDVEAEKIISKENFTEASLDENKIEDVFKNHYPR
jgi:hypothetical protein